MPKTEDPSEVSSGGVLWLSETMKPFPQPFSYAVIPSGYLMKTVL